MHAVGSAAEAVGEVRSWRPDVIVSDIAMPGENGYARTEDRRRALAAGRQTHVVQPVEPEELLAVDGRSVVAPRSPVD